MQVFGWPKTQTTLEFIYSELNAVEVAKKPKSAEIKYTRISLHVRMTNFQKLDFFNINDLYKKSFFISE